MNEPIIPWEPDDGAELIGTKLPEFEDLVWVNSKPLTISTLKGKPILIRFWIDGCTDCNQTIPTINYLNKTYSPKGLVSIGLNYWGGDDPQKARVFIDQLGVQFPVALDKDCHTLRSFWAKYKDKKYTDITLLIDKNGVIRWISSEGEISLPPSLGGSHKCRVFDSLVRAINKVLAEK